MSNLHFVLITLCLLCTLSARPEPPGIKEQSSSEIPAVGPTQILLLLEYQLLLWCASWKENFILWCRTCSKRLQAESVKKKLSHLTFFFPYVSIKMMLTFATKNLLEIAML